MKQNIALLLAAVLCISLCAGCGSSEKKEDSAGTENAGALRELKTRALLRLSMSPMTAVRQQRQNRRRCRRSGYL